MVAHTAQQLDGWWGGVLDPFEGFGVLLAIVVVGLLAGISSHAGREPWIPTSAFMIGVMGGLVVAAAGFQPSVAQTLMIGAALVGAALLSVDPPRISNSLPFTALAIGALAGVTVGVNNADQLGGRFIIGLLFTTAIVLACSSVAGAGIGRSVAARRTVAVLASITAVGLLLG